MADFKYRGKERTTEDVHKRAKMSGGSYDSWLSADVTTYTAKEGDATIRIMPPGWVDDPKLKEKWGTGWEITVWLHRNVGPDNGTYLCLDKMLGKRCPVCEARRDAQDEEEADALRVSPRPICYVVDRDNEKAGPQVMSMPMTLFREINARSIDKKTEGVILIDHPDEGFDILFTRTGTDKRTKYSAVEVDRDPSPLHDNEDRQDKWLDFITDNPLPELLQFYPEEHIEKVLFGKSERRRGRGADEEEEDTSSRRRGRDEEEEGSSRRRGRGRDTDEEDKGSRSSRRGRDKDEEEVEERPRRRGRDAEEGEEVEDRSSRRRGRDTEETEDKDDKESRSSRRGRDKDEEEQPERSSRRGRARDEEEGGEDDSGEKGGGVARRRRGASSDEPTDEEEGDTEAAAGKAADRLKGRLGRRSGRDKD